MLLIGNLTKYPKHLYLSVWSTRTPLAQKRQLKGADADANFFSSRKLRKLRVRLVNCWAHWMKGNRRLSVSLSKLVQFATEADCARNCDNLHHHHSKEKKTRKSSAVFLVSCRRRRPLCPCSWLAIHFPPFSLILRLRLRRASSS